MAKRKYNHASRRGMLAKIHMGKKQLGMDDDVYRNMLFDRHAVDSSSKLGLADMDDLIKHMAALGAEFTKVKKAAKPYVRKIYAQWGHLESLGAIEKPGRDSCAAHVRRMTKVLSPEWLGVDQAIMVIEGLKAWIKRVEDAK